MVAWFLFALCGALLFSTPVYAAVATPSSLDQLADDLDDLEDLSDMEVQDLLFDYLVSVLGGPGLATPAELPPASDTLDAVQEDSPVVTMLAPALEVALSDEVDAPDVNVVWYDCTISGQEYQVAFPKQYASSLWVSDAGYLYNVSGSDVTGRVFDEDPGTDDEFTLLILSSLFNTGSMTDLHEYGSLAELRSYYWDNTSYDRLRYTSSWVHVQVDHVSETLDTSQYAEYVIIFLLGGVLICLWRKSLR